MSQPTTELHATSNEFEDPALQAERRASGGEVRSIAPVRTAADSASETPVAAPESSALEELAGRVARVERNNRVLRYALVVLVLFTGYVSLDKLFPDGVIVQKTMMESKELKLVDNDGNARLFLRMYSRVPVLQLVDGNGKPRLSLGLRFDDTPFIDLSDRRGNTRASLEMNEDDSPALRLFDEHGDVSFKIN